MRELRSTEEWRRPRSLRGIAGVEIEHQRAFIRECCTSEVVGRLARRDVFDEACRANGAVGFGPIEAAFLYCVIATRRPSRVVQVGAGVSTAVVLTAAAEAGYEVEITCIDPFPTAYLRDLAHSNRIELIDQPVQRVSPERVADIGADGLLFVDSTHTVKVGGDVNQLVLEILPRISVPALVHFHDIVLPYDYSPTVLDGDLFFWNETALLTAFLTGNADFRLLTALSMVHHLAPEALWNVFPWYRPAPQSDGLLTGPGHFPASAYLEARPPATRH